MKARIFISLRTQFSNMGDLLINYLLLGELIEQGDVYVDASGVPDWYLELVIDGANENVKVLSRYSFMAKMLAFLIFKPKKNDVYLMLKPGGYMAISSWKMLAIRLMQGVWLKVITFLGGTVVRAPSSQQNSSGISKVVDKFRLSNIAYQMIRDEVSVAEVNSMNLKCISSFDMASLLFTDKNEEGMFDVKIDPRLIRKSVTFSFREREGLASFDWRAVAGLMPDLGYSCHFVSQVFGDNKFNLALSKLIDCHYVEYTGSRASISEVMGVYSGTKFIVSNRLHVLMAAASVGATPIAVISESDVKVSSYMKVIGCRENVIYIEAMTLDRLSQVLNVASNCNLTTLGMQGDKLKKQISKVFGNA